jgi:hypothetical protein
VIGEPALAFDGCVVNVIWDAAPGPIVNVLLVADVYGWPALPVVSVAESE